MDNSNRSADGVFVFDRKAETVDLGEALNLKLSQIEGIAVLAIESGGLAQDLHAAVYHAIQWIAADCRIIAEEMEGRTNDKRRRERAYEKE